MTGRPVVAALLAGLMLLTCAPSTRTDLAAANPSTQAAQATLTVLSASVTVVAGDSGIAHPGVSGQTVGVGDRILTDPSGGAALTFADGSELQLDAGTEVLPGDRKFQDYAFPSPYGYPTFARENLNRPIDRQPLNPPSDLGGQPTRFPLY